jgi:hypothetical protein
MRERKELNVPTSAKDIPLTTYQHLISCDETLQKDPYYVIALLCGVDVKVIQAMREQDVFKVMQIAESAVKFNHQEFQHKWKHKDILYGFHPNMEAMTLGEITDMENYMNDPESYHKAMAVCFRPITKEHDSLGGLYEIEPYRGTGETSDIMKNIPLSYFFGVRTFFLTTGEELERIIQQSSRQHSKQT